MEAISEEEIKNALAKSKQSIINAVVEHLKERLIHDIKYASNDAVEKEIKSFIDTEIVPETRKNLQENKAVILQQLNQAAVTIGAEVAKTLVSKAVTNMTGYRGTEILKKLVE